MKKRPILVMLGMIVSFGMGYLLGLIIFSFNYYQEPLFILANLVGLICGLLLMWDAKNKVDVSRNKIGLSLSGFYVLGLYVFGMDHKSLNNDLVLPVFICIWVILFCSNLLLEKDINKTLSKKKGSKL